LEPDHSASVDALQLAPFSSARIAAKPEASSAA
jgi:hypothetical protein